MPDDPNALSLLVALLTHAPKQVPAEVTEAIDAAVLRPHARIRRRTATVIVAAMALLTPLVVWTGVRDAKLLGIFAATWAAAALAARSLSNPRRAATMLPHTALAYGIAIGMSTVLFGPFILAPALSMGVGVLYVLGCCFPRSCCPRSWHGSEHIRSR